jgi:type II secretory pathway component PulC
MKYFFLIFNLCTYAFSSTTEIYESLKEARSIEVSSLGTKGWVVEKGNKGTFEKLGVREGDIITHINGKSVKEEKPSLLLELMGNLESVDVIRNNKNISLKESSKP